MYFMQCGFKIGVQVLMLLILSDAALSKSNYPTGWCHRKSCTRLKNTINYQGPICVSNWNNTDFTDEGVKACQALLATCPEFNTADCLWYQIAFPNASSTAKSMIPCCRLKYMACSGIRHSKSYTWMEVYYTLQYDGPAFYDLPVYDIVEVHRMVKNTKVFVKREQTDYPNSVSDPLGERGLAWVTDPPLDIALPNLTGAICPTNDTDPQCSNDIVDYLRTHHPKGFNDSLVPPKAKWEEKISNVTYEFIPACRDILINKIRTRACQVLYIRHATTPFDSKGKDLHDSSFEFLEVQVYLPPNGTGLALRYAYWSVEDPEARDRIFSNDKDCHT